MPYEAPPPLDADSSSRQNSAPVGCGGWVVGGASFIPLIGVPFGLAAIIWGFVRQAWSLVILGVCGILFTVVLYGSLFYFGFKQRGGVYDKLREQMAVTMLNNAVRDIEFYKVQHGHYPAQLAELNTKDRNRLVSVYDPTATQRAGTANAYFFYELAPDGGSYFLRSVGPDGVAFTGDDILPTLSDEERKNTGLKLEK